MQDDFAGIRQQAKVQILTLQSPKGQYFGLIYFLKYRNKHNNNSNNPLTSRRTDGGKMRTYVRACNVEWVVD